MSKDLLHRASEPTRRRVDKVLAYPNLRYGIPALLRLIRDNYCRSDIPIFQLQRQADVTEWGLKMFRKELGTTPGHLRIAMCLETATVLLRDTSLGLEEIAKLVGYESVRGLRELFVRWTGLAPSEVRRLLSQIPLERRQLAEELFSWYFWVRYHRGELSATHYREALDYFQGRIGPS